MFCLMFNVFLIYQFKKKLITKMIVVIKHKMRNYMGSNDKKLLKYFRTWVNFKKVGAAASAAASAGAGAAGAAAGAASAGAGAAASAGAASAGAGAAASAGAGARCELEGMTPELAIKSITNEESMKHVPYFIIHDAVMGNKFGSLREFYLFSEREIIDIINTKFEKYQKSMGIQKSVC
jgi:hypothetical protein